MSNRLIIVINSQYINIKSLCYKPETYNAVYQSNLNNKKISAQILYTFPETILSA